MLKILEDTRTELINKSKNVDIVKAYNATRYQRRVVQKEYTDVSSYNKIDMTALFVSNLLSFIVPIHGETADYKVEILFEKKLPPINFNQFNIITTSKILNYCNILIDK